ncbi:MAG: quinone oxidoreductase family protein [Alkalilacustris sp.]
MTEPFAIAAAAPGGADQLRRIPLTLPEPGPGEVRLRHTAIGVNFLDVYIREGLYPWAVDRDLIVGAEGAGIVEAVGPGVTDLKPGDRVAYTIQTGAYATHRIAPASMLVRLPGGVSDAQAAAAMLKGLTAHYLIHHSHPVQAGETVLVHAAAGGVGLIMGQWLAAKGVRAIGTAGGPEKCRLALENGYAEVIDYRREDFVARMAELTDGAGVPVVYDSVGADTVMGSLDCLARFGLLVSFGQSSGKPDQLRIAHLAKGSWRVTRPTLFHYVTRRDWLEAASADLFDMIASSKLQLRIGREAPLAEAADIHRALEARETTGSTVLLP